MSEPKPDRHPAAPSPRQRARYYALQALYQWQLGGHPAGEIETQFRTDPEFRGVDTHYFADLLQGVIREAMALAGLLTPHLDRGLERVDPVEQAILRIGAYELVHRLEIPYRVIINEAIELAKQFGAEQGHRYVNGVLDKLARSVRTAECVRKQPASR